MPTYHMAAEEDNELSLFKLTNVKLTDAQNAMTQTIFAVRGQGSIPSAG